MKADYFFEAADFFTAPFVGSAPAGPPSGRWASASCFGLALGFSSASGSLVLLAFFGFSSAAGSALGASDLALLTLLRPNRGGLGRLVVVVAVGTMHVASGRHGDGFAALLAFQFATLQTAGIEAVHGDTLLALALQLDQGLESGLVQQFLGDFGGGEEVVEDPVGAQTALD